MSKLKNFFFYSLLFVGVLSFQSIGLADQGAGFGCGGQESRANSDFGNNLRCSYQNENGITHSNQEMKSDKTTAQFQFGVYYGRPYYYSPCYNPSRPYYTQYYYYRPYSYYSW